MKDLRSCFPVQLEDLRSFLPRRTLDDDAASDISEGTPPSAQSAPSAPFGSMDIQDFTMLKPISRGSFGRVYLAQKNTTLDKYAIKASQPSSLYACISDQMDQVFWLSHKSRRSYEWQDWSNILL